MAFNWKTFLLDVVEVGPAIYGSVMGIKQEAPMATKLQMATDALNAATGVSTAILTSSDPAEVATANAASGIAASVIAAIHAETNQGSTT